MELLDPQNANHVAIGILLFLLLCWWAIYWFLFHFRVIGRLNKLQADLNDLRKTLKDK